MEPLQQHKPSKQKWRTEEARFSVNNLVCGGLLAIFLIILQNFIQTGLSNICAYFVVISLAVAMPCLAGCLINNQIENKYPYKYSAKVINMIYGMGLLSGYVGVVATFWYISWIAAVVFFIISLSVTLLCAYDAKRLSKDKEGLYTWQ